MMTGGSTRPGSIPRPSEDSEVRALTFFLLTFLLTWAVWFSAAALAAPGNTGFFGARGPLFLLGVFAPGIFALILTARDEGRAGVERLLARIGRWRGAW